MEVKLISHTNDPIEIMWIAARTCYNSKGPVEMHDNLGYKYSEVARQHEDEQDTIDEINKLKDKHWALVKKVLDSGHQSIAEHVYFTFAIEGISRACYDKDTEILTNTGWKLFKDLKQEDLVACRNTDGNLVFEKPLDYICYSYKGIMHHYKNKGTDLMITPNHNLYCRKYNDRNKDKPSYELVASQDIAVKRFNMDSRIFVPENVDSSVTIEGYSYLRRANNHNYFDKQVKSQTFDKELFTKFLAIYLSEGSTYYDEKENKYCISIAQRKNSSITHKPINVETRKEIKQVIESLGFNVTCFEEGLKFNSPLLGRFLKSLGISINKKFPFNIFEYFNKYYAQIFIDTYCRYDGNIYNRHKTLYTSSEQLKDDLQLIANIAGFGTRIILNKAAGPKHVYNNAIIEANANCYAISLSEKKNLQPFIHTDKYLTHEQYDDFVYCVEVPQHIILVRRNNVMCWCGNCSHQLVRHRAGIVFSQQSQRYVEIKENKDQLQALLIHPVSNKEQLIEIANKYFVNVTEDNYIAYLECLRNYLTQTANGVKAEDARNLLPNATKTNITMSINLRELIHICNLRLCTRAQLEIRNLFRLIRKQVETTMGADGVKLATYLVPTCEIHGYCFEDKCCGRKPKLSEILNKDNMFETFVTSEDMQSILNENPKVNEKLQTFMKQQLGKEDV